MGTHTVHDMNDSSLVLFDAEQVEAYLDGGVLLRMVGRLGADVLDDSRPYAIQSGVRGDGIMTWGISCIDYLRRYGYDPTGDLSDELLAHVRGRSYVLPEFSDEERAALRQQFKDSHSEVVEAEARVVAD